MVTCTGRAAADTLLLMTVCVYTYSRHTSGHLKYRSSWSFEETALSKAGSKPAPIHESRARAVASTLWKHFEKREGKNGLWFCTWHTGHSFVLQIFLSHHALSNNASIPRLHCGVWWRRTNPTGRCQGPAAIGAGWMAFRWWSWMTGTLVSKWWQEPSESSDSSLFSSWGAETSGKCALGKSFGWQTTSSSWDHITQSTTVKPYETGKCLHSSLQLFSWQIIGKR